MTALPYSKKILELADKWVKGTITEPEKKEFIDWYNRFDDRELLLAPAYAPLLSILEKEMLTGIRQRIAEDISPPSRQDLSEPQAPFQKEGGALYRMKWLRVSAAAVLLGVLAIGILLLASRKTLVQAPIVVQKPTPPVQADVLPGGNKALLTLGDGSTIVLDSARTGRLTRQGNTRVLKLEDGRLMYQSVTGKDLANNAPNNSASLSYNILSTPKGGQYRLILPDGSQVWLNAASSIRYPTAFTGADREVEVSGEAYFEVTKNASMPFRVLVSHRLLDTNPMEIEVLGTHFNVNSYADETAIRTTLLEGSVKVIRGTAARILQPGQQTQLQENGKMQWAADADVEQAVAWKNGVFEFKEEDLQAIMRQISRWYDVEVVYEGKIPTDEFTGRVSRNTSLSGLLKILKLSDIRITIENNKIIVRS